MKTLGAALLGAITGLAFQTQIPLVFVLPALSMMFALTFRSSRSRWILQWFVFALSQFVVGLKWLDVVGMDIVLIVGIFCSVWFLLASILASFARDPLHRTTLLIFTLTLFENIRDSFPFGGFGWLQYGIVLVETPFSILHRILPQLLMTLLVLALAAFIGLSLQKAISRRAMIVFATSLIFISSVSLINLVEIDKNISSSIVAVQGGVERYGLGVLGDRTEVLKNHIEITKENSATISQASLVVWPENSLDVDPALDQTAATLLEDIDEFVAPPLLLGAVLSPDSDSRSNETLEIDDGIRKVYTKQRLVPFGEFLPFRDLATSITDRAALLPHDFIPGNSPGFWERGDLRVSLGICFEVADAFLIHQEIDESDLIIIQTNNATYQFSNQSEQQLIYAKIRSIESGRPLVSVSTSGITALISDGKLLKTLAKGKRGILTFEVNDYSGRTLTSLFAKYAGWTVLILWGTCIVIISRRQNQ